MMAKKTEKRQTPVVEYWGLLRDPFQDRPLVGTRLNLFAGRANKVADLRDAIDNPLVGIHGSLGSGKTSFLRKAAEILRKEDSCNVVFIDLGSCTAKYLYRTLLRFLLEEIKVKNIKLRKNSIDIEGEIERLESTVSYISEFGGGVQVIVKAEMSHTIGREIAQHTEESSTILIYQLLELVRDRTILLIDDIERVKYVLTEQEMSYLQTVSRFSMTFRDLSNEQVSIVISLDDHFTDLVHAEQTSGNGEFSFSFGELIEIRGFTLADLLEAIRLRLQDAGWNEGIAGFIDADASLYLFASTAGHPRKAFNVLRKSLRHISRNQLERHIDREVILFGIRDANISFDDTDKAVIDYLLEKGPSSPSDQAFQDAIVLKRVALSERLKTLQQKSVLQVETADRMSGRQVFALPAVPGD